VHVGTSIDVKLALSCRADAVVVDSDVCVAVRTGLLVRNAQGMEDLVDGCPDGVAAR